MQSLGPHSLGHGTGMGPFQYGLRWGFWCLQGEAFQCMCRLEARVGHLPSPEHNRRGRLADHNQKQGLAGDILSSSQIPVQGYPRPQSRDGAFLVTREGAAPSNVRAYRFKQIGGIGILPTCHVRDQTRLPPTPALVNRTLEQCQPFINVDIMNWATLLLSSFRNSPKPGPGHVFSSNCIRFLYSKCFW